MKYMDCRVNEQKRSMEHIVAVILYSLVLFSSYMSSIMVFVGFTAFFVFTSIKRVWRMVLFMLVVGAILDVFPLLAPFALILMVVLFVLRIKYVKKHWPAIRAGLIVYGSSVPLYWRVENYYASGGYTLLEPVIVSILGGFILHRLLVGLYEKGYSTSLALGIMGGVPLVILGFVMPFLKLHSWGDGVPHTGLGHEGDLHAFDIDVMSHEGPTTIISHTNADIAEPALLHGDIAYHQPSPNLGNQSPPDDVYHSGHLSTDTHLMADVNTSLSASPAQFNGGSPDFRFSADDSLLHLDTNRGMGLNDFNETVNDAYMLKFIRTNGDPMTISVLHCASNLQHENMPTSPRMSLASSSVNFDPTQLSIEENLLLCVEAHVLHSDHAVLDQLVFCDDDGTIVPSAQSNIFKGVDIFSPQGTLIASTHENIFQGADVYTAQGVKIGWSQPNIFGGMDIFNAHSVLVATTHANLNGGQDIYDAHGSRIGYIQTNPIATPNSTFPHSTTETIVTNRENHGIWCIDKEGNIVYDYQYKWSDSGGNEM